MAQTRAQVEAQLEAVQAAITKCLSAEEYYIGGERIRRPNLDALQKREQTLLARLAAFDAGATTNIGSYRRDP